MFHACSSLSFFKLWQKRQANSKLVPAQCDVRSLNAGASDWVDLFENKLFCTTRREMPKSFLQERDLLVDFSTRDFLVQTKSGLQCWFLLASSVVPMPHDDARSNVWELVVRSGSANVLRTLLGMPRPQFLPVHRPTSAPPLSETPFMSRAVCVVRAPAWCTGLRTKCRCIDDMLEEKKRRETPQKYNLRACHLPLRASQPSPAPQRGLPNAFASEYRQAADLEQAHLCAVATWSYSDQCAVSGLAVTQVFDGTSASLVLLDHSIFYTVAALTIA